MASSRVYEKPSFSEVNEPWEREKLVKEVQKIKPMAEVTLEGYSELAKGRIIDWNEQRKLLTVKWKIRSDQFDELTNAKTGLRAFFKAQLFTTQIVFKTTTVRRCEDGTYHYRIPSELFQQQRRGALRVPIHSGSVQFFCDQGKFQLFDLSVGGASLKTSEGRTLSRLTSCELRIGSVRVKTDDFSAQVTFRTEGRVGVRFAGLNESVRIKIKQFLIEALKLHYEQEW